MRYKLYQIKDWRPSKYVFRNWETALKNNFSLNDYKVVYEGEVEDITIEAALEKLFTLFNVYHPEDFEGEWSMSISDIVELEGEYYYTESFGFKKITDMCSWYIPPL